MNQEKIGTFISQLRKERNMTQSELAEKLGVTDRSVSRWENGKTMPDYSIIKSLCDELDISINELFSGEKIEKEKYEIKTNENIDNILKEYYKIKKQRRIIGNLFVVSLMIVILFMALRILVLLGIVSLTSLSPAKNISGIENYDKNYYIEEYGGDLSADLLIFPEDKTKLINAEFSSSMQTNFFDTDGYILLTTQYSKVDFEKEISRLKSLELTISDGCNDNAKTYTNKIIYDTSSYTLPAYITSDGFAHTYEYALINNDKFEITYIYLSHPKANKSVYKKYLKKKKSEYYKSNTINIYSMYYHSFDGGSSFYKYDDCEKFKGD